MAVWGRRKFGTVQWAAGAIISLAGTVTATSTTSGDLTNTKPIEGLLQSRRR
jgi:hypothetical protein